MIACPADHASLDEMVTSPRRCSARVSRSPCSSRRDHIPGAYRGAYRPAVRGRGALCEGRFACGRVCQQLVAPESRALLTARAKEEHALRRVQHGSRRAKSPQFTLLQARATGRGSTGAAMPRRAAHARAQDLRRLFDRGAGALHRLDAFLPAWEMRGGFRISSTTRSSASSEQSLHRCAQDAAHADPRAMAQTRAVIACLPPTR